MSICFADWRETFGDIGLPVGSGNKSCLLEDGHDGPHEWTPNSEIIIKFIESSEPALRKP